jgi:hypothetical protein
VSFGAEPGEAPDGSEEATLGGVDPVKPDPLAVDLDGVAVDHGGDACDRGGVGSRASAGLDLIPCLKSSMRRLSPMENSVSRLLPKAGK